MRRISTLVMLAGMVALSSGCVVAMGNKGLLKANSARQAVVMNGQIYVVDTKKMQVTRIEPGEFMDTTIVIDEVTHTTSELSDD